MNESESRSAIVLELGEEFIARYRKDRTGGLDETSAEVSVSP